MVIGFGVFSIGDDDFGNSRLIWICRSIFKPIRQDSTVGFPLSQQAMIPLATFVAAEGAQPIVSAFLCPSIGESENSLVVTFTLTLGGSFLGHRAALLSALRGVTPRKITLQAAPPRFGR